MHFAPYYFLNITHPVTIAVIGCGGTGSLTIPRLARLDYALQKLGHPGLHVMVYDGDIVEQNNVGRQNFTVSDIGQFKASNIIEKVNYAFGLQWEAINEYINPLIPRCNITITCVDVIKPRLDIKASIKTIYANQYDDYTKKYYWIDAGNGKDFGQVVLGTISKIKQPKTSLFKTVSNLKNVFDLFPLMEENDNIDDQGIEGCSMHSSLHKQDLFINDNIAVHICQILYKLIYEKQIEYNGVIINQESFITKGFHV